MCLQQIHDSLRDLFVERSVNGKEYGVFSLQESLRLSYRDTCFYGEFSGYVVAFAYHSALLRPAENTQTTTGLLRSSIHLLLALGVVVEAHMHDYLGGQAERPR